MHRETETPRPVSGVPGEDNDFCAESPSGAGLEPLLEQIRLKHGEALLAILVYGSWLRGKRDTMLDFYVLVEDYHTLDSAWQGWMCRILPPNVYHIHQPPDDNESEEQPLRAKYALLTLKRFHQAMQNDFHSYFWARFSQPCEVLYVRDEKTRTILTDAFKHAATTFIRRVLPVMEDSFNSGELWARGLSLTYQCELRTEGSDRGESIYNFNPGYYEQLTKTFARENESLSYPVPGDLFYKQSNRITRVFSSPSWWIRRIQGKFLSVMRLMKAAFTFNEPLEYLLWKIERHSGIYIEPTPRQIKHPLIFAWPLLWKLRRLGAFR